MLIVNVKVILFIIYFSGLTLYNTFNNIAKGSDLTTYCILSTIEDWQTRHGGKMPETIYLQIDGGSENANKYVIAMCELMCAKRLAKDIWITRLPVGHTHSDIDACFGHIWKWMRGRPIETLDDYFHGIKTSFAATSLNPIVKFVYTIPNYQDFFEKHIDKDFGNYTKLDSTQHCCRIQAVEASIMFPLGLKTLFRKYSSDRVIELIKKDPAKCHSPIGRVIGLEPLEVRSKWFPDKFNDLVGRQGIEGFYTLSSLPSCDLHPIAPLKFDPKGVNAIRQCYFRVKQKWPNLEDPIRQWWDGWVSMHAPFCETVDEFLETRVLHFPLGSYLKKRDIMYIPMWTVHLLSEDTSTAVSFQWPTEYVYALPSVTSSWSREVRPYRSQILSSNPMIQNKLKIYKETTNPYYRELTQRSSTYLYYSIIQTRIDDKGNLLATKSSTKGQMITKIMNDDYELYRQIFRAMIPEVKDLLHKKLNQQYSGALEGDQCCVKCCDNGITITLTNDDIRCFKENTPLSESVVNYVMFVSNYCGKRSQSAYNSLNSETRGFEVLKLILYLPSINVQNISTFESLRRQNIVLESYNKVIIPGIDNEFWTWFCIDVKNQSVIYYNPSRASSISKTELKNKTYLIKQLFNIHDFKSEFPPVNILSLPSSITYQDSGIYCLCTIHSFINQYPFIATQEDTKLLRDNCCLDLLSVVRQE